MTERTWHNGPPPHVGWWNASRFGHAGVWRWWDGERWSIPVDDTSVKPVAEFLEPTTNGLPPVEWTDYWPENARVPRLDPTDGDWTFNTDGKRPEYTGRIDIVFRNGGKCQLSGLSGVRWNIQDDIGDIVAWRPAK